MRQRLKTTNRTMKKYLYWTWHVIYFFRFAFSLVKRVNQGSSQGPEYIAVYICLNVIRSNSVFFGFWTKNAIRWRMNSKLQPLTATMFNLQLCRSEQSRYFSYLNYDQRCFFFHHFFFASGLFKPLLLWFYFKYTEKFVEKLICGSERISETFRFYQIIVIYSFLY